LGTIIVSGKLGPKRSSEVKGKNFECGIESVGNARIPFSVKYLCSYIICFVCGRIFLYPWAINFQGIGNGRNKMVILCFAFGGFFSSSKKKALEWE
jgi:NADH-quinone oxidoreductase subunit A